MTIQERITELGWLNEQLKEEAATLTTTQHPNVHWFLIDNLAVATMKRAERLHLIARDTIVESYTLTDGRSA